MESKPKINHLVAAEIGEEQNYNNIDGIINNVQKPSILDQMKEYQQKITEANADKTDKTAPPKGSCKAEEKPFAFIR